MRGECEGGGGGPMRRIPMYPVETVNSCTTPWEPWGVSTSSSCSTTSSSSMHSGPLPSQLWSHAGRQRERGLSHNQTLTPAIPVTRDQIPRMCDIDIYKYAGSISRRVAVVTSQGGGGRLHHSCRTASCQGGLEATVYLVNQCRRSVFVDQRWFGA